MIMYQIQYKTARLTGIVGFASSVLAAGMQKYDNMTMRSRNKFHKQGFFLEKQEYGRKKIKVCKKKCSLIMDKEQPRCFHNGNFLFSLITYLLILYVFSNKYKVQIRLKYIL